MTFYNILKHNRKQFLSIFILLIFLFLLYNDYNSEDSETLADSIWNTVDPIAGILAFFITLFVLYNQGKQKYLDSLEKRLSVDYYLLTKEEPKLIMQIEQAYLAGESDIRQWAQSLGGQQLTGRHLSFDLHFETIFEGKIDKDTGGGEFLHFKINMYLDDNPKTDVTLVTENKDSKSNRLLKEEKYMHSILRRPSQNDIWTWKRKS